jgi:hypothetical protein
MIKVFFDGVDYNIKEINNLESLSKKIIENRKKLDNLPLEDILEIIHQFSENILKNPKTRSIEGIAFVSQWFRKFNLEKIININFGNKEILGNYSKSENKMIIAQPKGLIGHWIAGNVITLGIFSLIQSLLVRNANILRVPKNSIPLVLELLKTFGESKYNGIKGYDLLSSTAVIYYPHEDKKSNEEFSLLCDTRIIWGGEESVNAISNTSKKENCEDIIFGPKYSFSIIDSETIHDVNLLKKTMNNLVYDIIFSEQNSCTSPQILFCEGTYSQLDKVADELENAFKVLPKKYEKMNISMFQASNIIKARSEYALENEKDLLISSGNDWTILKDKNLQLEEPIKSRTIFIKSCNNLYDILNLITPKIQTIGYMFQNKERLIDLSKKLNLKGVSRIVPIGQMNYYDAPWDGKLLLTRLVNFNSLKLPTDLE